MKKEEYEFYKKQKTKIVKTLKEIKKIVEEKKIKTIIITGTPGTGKTTLAKKLEKKLKTKSYNVKEEAEKQKLIEGYDKKRQSKIIDEKKIELILQNIKKEKQKKTQTKKEEKEKSKKVEEKKKAKKTNKNKSENIIILEGHLAHYTKPKKDRLIIITTTSLKKLKERLKKRKYKKTKIEENLQSEIFKIIFLETKEQKHKNIIVYEN